MKKFSSHVLLSAFCMPLLGIRLANAALLVGDTIVADFTNSSTGASTTFAATGEYWNDYAVTSGTSISGSDVLFADLVRVTDGNSTGVTFSRSSGSGNAGIGSGTIGQPIDNSASFLVTGAIPLTAQQDVIYSNSTITFSFGGLDDSLTYRVSIQSWTDDSARNANDWVLNSGLGSEQAISVDPNNTPSVYTFNVSPTNGSGGITLTSSGGGGGGNAMHINAFEVTVIPEPSTFALFGIAGCLAFCFGRRRCDRKE